MASDATDRIVFDTNILVSGYLFPLSTPGQAVELGLSSHRILMSMEIVRELASVLRREKFDRFLSPGRRDELIAKTILQSEFVATSAIITDCRDPADNKFLELAIDGHASAIVSGDADLLVVHPFRGIPIFSARDYLSRYTTV
jgi:putative PIN family toxin of toxin-antitoxin system